jgi:hypothetical protein
MLWGDGSSPGPSDAGGKADTGARTDGTGGLAAEAPGVAAITRPVSAVSAARPPKMRLTDLRAQPRDARRRTRIPAPGPPWPGVTAVRRPSGIPPLNWARARRGRRRARRGPDVTQVTAQRNRHPAGGGCLGCNGHGPPGPTTTGRRPSRLEGRRQIPNDPRTRAAGHTGDPGPHCHSRQPRPAPNAMTGTPGYRPHAANAEWRQARTIAARREADRRETCCPVRGRCVSLAARFAAAAARGWRRLAEQEGGTQMRTITSFLLPARTSCTRSFCHVQLSVPPRQAAV